MQTNTDFGSDSWEARDLQSMLHGFTDLGSLNDGGPVVMSRGEGIYVEDIHGKRYLEGNSGLWNAVAGFNPSGDPGGPEIHGPREAEWAVFRLRWKAHTGRDLEL